MRLLDLLDACLIEKSEELNQPDYVRVRYISPKLIELKRWCQRWIQPDRVSRRLAELLSGGGHQQWDRQSEHLGRAQLSDEVHSGSDVPPLVATTDLNAASERTE